MSELEALLERMRRVEALFARTDVPGEKAAAERARDAILEQLQKYRQTDPPIEFRFKLADSWSRRLFMALARRYGLQPYRYHGQRHTTVMLRVSKSFCDGVLWPEFRELSDLLESHLETVTSQVIAQVLNASDADETQVVAESSGALPGPKDR